MMPGSTVALIVGAVAFSALGQVLLKTGAQHLAPLGGFEFLAAAGRNVHVLAGLASWIASTLCWLYVLRVAPLSVAYGLTSLTYLLVPLAGIVVFGEHLRRLQVGGMVLIIVGIVLVMSAEPGRA